MSEFALNLPRRSPRAFLVLAAALWPGMYRVLQPVAQALVGLLPVDPASQLGDALELFFCDKAIHRPGTCGKPQHRPGSCQPQAPSRSGQGSDGLGC
jgi:hypothetical protein